MISFKGTAKQNQESLSASSVLEIGAKFSHRFEQIFFTNSAVHSLTNFCFENLFFKFCISAY